MPHMRPNKPLRSEPASEVERLQRNQNLTANQYLAFARALGEPIEYPFVKGAGRLPRDHRGEKAGA